MIAGLGRHRPDRLEILAQNQVHPVESLLKLLAQDGFGLALNSGYHRQGAAGYLGQIVEKAVTGLHGGTLEKWG